LPETGEAREGALPGIFAGLFGALLGLALLKFGNPVVLEHDISWPSGFLEWMIDLWPPVIGYCLLGGVSLIGLLLIRWRSGAPRLLIALPLAWLAWEAIAGSQTVDASLTRPTLVHFAGCVACFYLGLFALARVRRLWPFWAGLLAGFALVLASGFQQHFGGLEQTRQYFNLYHPDGQGVSPAILARMNDNRIFATLFYPNTLAAVILLLLPVMLSVIGSSLVSFTAGARRFLMAVGGGAALACLYWSGSKGGWLLMVFTGFVASLFLPMKRQFKLALAATLLLLGLTGFFARHYGYFKKGATSAVARVDYWEAAVETVRDKPLFGTGPGTFAIAYKKVKKPESEMARMTHNDYLEQASDSGLPGFILYSALVACTLVCTIRKRDRDWLHLSIWLGTLAWALQSLLEFGLYIPAVAWPAFTFMGWLLGNGAKPSTAPGSSATIQPSR
jgi:hypothetical protein